jgi:hypothetical protein
MKIRDIPDFKLSDIMGEFEVDMDGNFIIVKEKGQLKDKRKNLVNERGYLVDENGNVVNKSRVIIFKKTELDMNGEIPAPFLVEDSEYEEELERLES